VEQITANCVEEMRTSDFVTVKKSTNKTIISIYYGNKNVSFVWRINPHQK